MNAMLTFGRFVLLALVLVGAWIPAAVIAAPGERAQAEAVDEATPEVQVAELRSA